MLQYLTSGLDMADVGLMLNRLALGLFYFLARFRFFYDPSKPAAGSASRHYPSQRWFNADRRNSLTRKMQHCGLKNQPAFWAWTAAIVEVVGGLMLILGLFAPLAAAALLVLTIRATMCTWKDKIYEQHPVDLIDCAACYLWRVEGLYIVMAATVLFGGPGLFSLT